MDVREPSDEVGVLQEVVRRSVLPVALVDLDGLRFLTGSPSAAAMLRQSDLDNLGLMSLVEDGPDTRTALELLRSGAADSFKAHRLLLEPRADDIGMSMWVRALAMRGFAGWALGILTMGDRDDAALALVPDVFATPAAIAVGTSDLSGGLHHISPEIESLLGVPGGDGPGELDLLVDPSVGGGAARVRVGAITAVGRTGRGDARLRAQNGEWAPVRIVVKVGPADRGPRVGVAIVRDQHGDRPDVAHTADVDPAALVGLAGEIRALDIVDAMALLPGDGDLPRHAEKMSEREWEVVARLLRGDRVPAIAKAIYLSPSTVRNHLSAVFRKLGVGSQQELISLFRGDGMRDSSSG